MEWERGRGRDKEGRREEERGQRDGEGKRKREGGEEGEKMRGQR